jgi:hypothetical protein
MTRPAVIVLDTGRGFLIDQVLILKSTHEPRLKTGRRNDLKENFFNLLTISEKVAEVQKYT